MVTKAKEYLSGASTIRFGKFFSVPSQKNKISFKNKTFNIYNKEVPEKFLKMSLQNSRKTILSQIFLKTSKHTPAPTTQISPN